MNLYSDNMRSFFKLNVFYWEEYLILLKLKVESVENMCDILYNITITLFENTIFERGLIND